MLIFARKRCKTPFKAQEKQRRSTHLFESVPGGDGGQFFDGHTHHLLRRGLDPVHHFEDTEEVVLKFREGNEAVVVQIVQGKRGGRAHAE